ncbi:hypothetical protein [Mucilaginibacter lacusdianchii]|uniref:hypothetical protein n=1 Tax=Mucilaginibacter lacusdianchii TaxID=2684211 RepID=UPI00131A8AB5|nr:hypothetical protein [Mucilaginibacter sp. JXJ CY 39]
MLFVSDYCGELIHEKYQYFEVYPTKNHRWATPDDPYRMDHVEMKDIKAVPVEFASPVYYDTKKLHLTFKRKFQDPYYFKVNDTTAVPLLGTYSEDLLRIKMDGNLKRVFAKKR